MYDPAYLRRARELCDRFEVHLIADEIAVGCGRTGTFFAHEQAGVRPDFLCLSKGISGGYLPLSVVLTTRRRCTRPSTATRPRAASCIRTRTPATRWPARRRSRRSICSRPTTSSRPTACAAQQLTQLCEPLRAHPAVARLPQLRHDLGLRRARGRGRTSRAHSSWRRSIAGCCCARSATPSTSCRPTWLARKSARPWRRARWRRCGQSRERVDCDGPRLFRHRNRHRCGQDRHRLCPAAPAARAGTEGGRDETGGCRLRAHRAGPDQRRRGAIARSGRRPAAARGGQRLRLRTADRTAHRRPARRRPASIWR